MSDTLSTESGNYTPKYILLSEKLRLAIREGVYPQGSRLPSCRELTSILGVSYLTVNNVLQSLEKEGYVKRLHGKGTFVTSQKASRIEKNMKIAYLMDVNVSIFGRLFSSVLDILNGQPVYNVPLNMPSETQFSYQEAEEWLDKAMKNHYNSLVIYGDRHFPYRALSKYTAGIEQLNMIVFDSSSVKFSGVNRILVDVEEVGFLAASRFLKNGFRKMAVLALRQLDEMHRRQYEISGEDQSKLMLDGVERAYNEKGLDFFEFVKVIHGPCNEIPGDNSRFESELQACLKGDYKAYFTMGDYRARKIYEQAGTMNLKIGRDIFIISFLNTSICPLMNPPLTSISINEPEIGGTLARAIQENWRNKTVMIKPLLIERESDIKVKDPLNRERTQNEKG